MIKVNDVELPFFPGFYETLFDERDLLCSYYNEDDESYYRGIKTYGLDFDADDIEVDSKEYREDVCKEFVKNFNTTLPDWILKVEFRELWSPQYYNFESDRLYTDITFADNYRDVLLKYINDNYEDVKEKIHKKWSSRDGFISFIDNNIDNWIEDIKNNRLGNVELYYLIELYYRSEILPNWADDEIDTFVLPVYENICIVNYFYHDKKDYIDREKQIEYNKKFLKDHEGQYDYIVEGEL